MRLEQTSSLIFRSWMGLLVVLLGISLIVDWQLSEATNVIQGQSQAADARQDQCIDEYEAEHGAPDADQRTAEFLRDLVIAMADGDPETAQLTIRRISPAAEAACKHLADEIAALEQGLQQAEKRAGIGITVSVLLALILAASAVVRWLPSWGVVITGFYVLALLVFVVPVILIIFGDADDFFTGLTEMLSAMGPGVGDGGWGLWLIVAIFATAQALLVLVSVDTSRKRLRPRRHVAVSVAAITFAVGLLTAAAVWAVLAAILGDALDFPFWWLLTPPSFWLLWGIVFYLYRAEISARLDKAVNWLLAGSVLELLIAVPCHIIVRQRDDCSAPIATGFGIATGIAVMLMAFGPSVIFLYQKRLGQYKRNGPTASG